MHPLYPLPHTCLEYELQVCQHHAVIYCRYALIGPLGFTCKCVGRWKSNPLLHHAYTDLYLHTNTHSITHTCFHTAGKPVLTLTGSSFQIRKKYFLFLSFRITSPGLWYNFAFIVINSGMKLTWEKTSAVKCQPCSSAKCILNQFELLL